MDATLYNSRFGISYLSTTAGFFTDGNETSGRKKWRRRLIKGQYKTFWGLIQHKIEPFGGHLFRNRTLDIKADYWDCLETRKSTQDGWEPE